MSYFCEISFKKIDAANIPDFLSSVKREIIKLMDDIAGTEFIFMPANSLLKIPEDFTVSTMRTQYPELAASCMAWVERVFKYRWFYDKEWKLLGVHGVPNCIKGMFDATVYFQNNTDQDYEREAWNGIEEFTAAYDKWQNASIDAVKKALENSVSDNSVPGGYERRSLCYREIWGRYSDSLYDDGGAIYLALFGAWDMTYQDRFLSKCLEHAKELRKARRITKADGDRGALT